MSSSAPSLQMCSTPWILAQEEPLRRRSPSNAQPRAEQGAGLLPVPAWCGGCPAWPPAPEHPQELPGEQQTAGPCPDVAAALTDINHRASLWDRGRWCSPPWIISHGLLIGNRWKRRCLKPELRSLLWSRCIQGGFSQASHGCACSSTEVMLEQGLCSPSATLGVCRHSAPPCSQGTANLDLRKPTSVWFLHSLNSPVMPLKTKVRSFN